MLVLALGCRSSAGPAPESPSAAAVSVGDSPGTSPGDSPSAPPVAQAAVGTAVPDAMRGIVEAHNARRAAHCAPPLAWSPEVAAVAQRYADQLREGGCNLAHSSGPYGENLYGASPAGGTSAAAVVDAWYSEVAQYNPARPGFSMQTGHYTQVVWRGTARVGCGVARCADAEVWVCNYDPPGNVQGSYPENVAPTGCRTGASKE